MVSARVADWLCDGLLESVTEKVREVADTAVVGVPLIAPVEVFSVRPAGSVPLVKAHVYGAVPPLAESVVL